MATQKSGEKRGRKPSGHTRQAKSSGKPRIPPEFAGLQVNFCKNNRCANFGVPAVQTKDPNYTITGDVNYHLSEKVKSKKTKPDASGRQLKCKFCRQHNPIKSNKAVIETLRTLDWSPDNRCCPVSTCENRNLPVNTNLDRYYKKGKTQTGNQRWLCRICKKSFVITRNETNPSRGKLHSRYASSIRALVNGAPMNRILEIEDINPSVLYHNIDRAFQACLRFNQSREARYFKSGKQLGRILLCSDRQTYMLNWSRREDKRNMAFRAVGTAEIFSGFVFPLDVNYDPHANAALVNEESKNTGDWLLTPSLRDKPQYWLGSDYAGISNTSASTGSNTSPEGLYEATLARMDVESPDDNLAATTALPEAGIQLREDYAMYAHFRRLSDYLSNASSICLFTEQESGIRAAIFGNFIDRIKSKEVRHYYVDSYKQATREHRERAQREGKQILNNAMGTYSCDEATAYHYLMLDAQNDVEERGHWKDLWFRYPVPSLAEVQKDLCHMTGFDDDDPEKLAQMARWGTILPIDNFFQVVRRRLSPLERPVTSAAAEGRKWTGKAPYNPLMTIKILEILRTYFNYSSMGKKKRETPAMKLGLAKGPVELRDILEPRTNQ